MDVNEKPTKFDHLTIQISQKEQKIVKLQEEVAFLKIALQKEILKSGRS